jgi:predicted transcriptional regulator of viral defense system
MPHSKTLDVLAGLAEDQWGLFTRQQAAAAGLAWTTLSRLVANGAAERVAHGVYRLRGSPPAEHLDLLAAWLQLAPDTPAWERGPDTGVVSHRSAAALFGLGELTAGVHEFTLPTRRQSRRRDVRLHQASLMSDEWVHRRGLPVTRPARTAADLLGDREDPEAVARVITDALREHQDDPVTFARALAPHATRLGLRRADGLAALQWLIGLTGDPEQGRWMEAATASQGGPTGTTRRDW